LHIGSRGGRQEKKFASGSAKSLNALYCDKGDIDNGQATDN